MKAFCLVFTCIHVWWKQERVFLHCLWSVLKFVPCCSSIRKVSLIMSFSAIDPSSTGPLSEEANLWVSATAAGKMSPAGARAGPCCNKWPRKLSAASDHRRRAGWFRWGCAQGYTQTPDGQFPTVYAGKESETGYEVLHASLSFAWVK